MIFLRFFRHIYIYLTCTYIYIHICILSVERFQHEPLGSGDWVTTPYVTDVNKLYCIVLLVAVVIGHTVIYHSLRPAEQNSYIACYRSLSVAVPSPTK